LPAAIRIASRRFDELLRKAAVAIEPVTQAQAEVARAAYRDFGKGSGHPAKLNFGDCFAYALAKGTGGPLLFKGSDFGHTDVVPAFRWGHSPQRHRGAEKNQIKVKTLGGRGRGGTY